MKNLTTKIKAGSSIWSRATRIISIIVLILGLAGAIQAQTTGDYRTVASGDFNTASIWETYNGSAWVAASSAPDFNNGLISIRSGHSVQVTDSINIDQTIVEAGGELILSVNTTGSIYLNNGSGDDLDIEGTFRQQSIDYGIKYIGSGSATAVMSVDSAGLYVHEIDAGSIPHIHWDDSSTVLINSIDTASVILDGSFAQSFGKLIWDNDSQKLVFHIRSQGNAPITAKLFTVESTGTGAIDLGDTGTVAPTFVNFIMNDGTAYINYDGTKERSVTITNDFKMFGGFFGVNNSDTSTAAGNLIVIGDFILRNDAVVNIATTTERGSISVKGDVDIGAGSTLTRSSTGGTIGNSNFIFMSGPVRNFINNGLIDGSINWTVSSGADVDFGTYVLYGVSFQNNIDSRLRIGHPDGIWADGIGSNFGNIQTTIREFSRYGYYEYNGTTNQITGDGLPSIISIENDTLNIGGLIINNSGGDVILTQNTRVSGLFSLIDGRLITESPLGVLTLGTTAYLLFPGSDSSHVWGPLARRTNAIQHYYYPIGDDGIIKPVSIKPQTTALTLFTSTAFNNPYTDVTSVGTGLNNVSKLEYWTICQDISDNDAVIRLYWNVNSEVNDTTSTDLRVVRWDGSMWVDEGQDGISGTEMWVEAMVAGADMATSASGCTHFTFGSMSSAVNPLPVELISFTGRYMEGSVLLEWSTASEKDNDYFIIERSLDAREFAQIGERIPGNGTSTRTVNYSMVDDNNVSGNRTLYYRLRQVDYDGTQHITNVIAVYPGKHNETVEIAVHPNPFVKDLNIKLSGSANSQFEIRIMDVTGKVVASQTGFLENGNAEINLPVQSLQSGVYMVHVNSGSNNVVTKIMKK